MDKRFGHSRLRALLDSKVINALTIVTICGVLVYAGMPAIPLISFAGATVAFALAVGYSLWFMIKRPGSIVVNKQLSGFNSAFTLYFLIVAAGQFESPLWYIFPVVCAVIQLFVTLVRNGDERLTF